MLEELKHFAKRYKVYMLGKGILTLGVFAAAATGAALGIGSMLPAMVVGLGGIALTTVSRLSHERLYKEEMLEVYRDSLAEKFQMKREDVGLDELKEAAKDNDVIRDALKRQHQRTLLAIAGATVSGLLSIGLIGFFGFDDTLRDLAKNGLGAALKPLAQFISVGTVSGLIGLVVRDGLETAVGYGSGIHQATAHDRMVAMQRKLQQGKPIAREEVYSVFAEGNPALAQRIHHQFGHSYTHMSHAQQAQVLKNFGLQEKMDALTDDLMRGVISPGHLSFQIGNFHAQGVATSKTPHAVSADQSPQGTFVQRLGLEAKPAQGHVAHLNAARSQPEYHTLSAL